jgi:hypothetical protein
MNTGREYVNSKPTSVAWWTQASRRWAIRLDVVLGVLAAILFSAIAGWQVAVLLTQTAIPAPDIKSIISAVVAAWVAIVLACIGGAIKITSARQNLITLFTSEIRAIQYGLGQMDMFSFWKDLHANPANGAIGFADVPREEDYFAIYHSATGNVGNLHPRVVEAIVRFYTYLKMSRDAAASLASWKRQKDDAVRRLHVEYVVRLLSLSMTWGFAARWYMGQEADPDDVDLLDRLTDCVDSVQGPGSYDTLKQRHRRRHALDGFFGATKFDATVKQD